MSFSDWVNLLSVGVSSSMVTFALSFYLLQSTSSSAALRQLVHVNLTALFIALLDAAIAAKSYFDMTWLMSLKSSGVEGQSIVGHLNLPLNQQLFYAQRNLYIGVYGVALCVLLYYVHQVATQRQEQQVHVDYLQGLLARNSIPFQTPHRFNGTAKQQ